MVGRQDKQLEQMNATLRKMLNTPPKPHKEKREPEGSRPSEKKTKQSVQAPKERS
jgi:hypothetical protein